MYRWYPEVAVFTELQCSALACALLWQDAFMFQLRLGGSVFTLLERESAVQEPEGGADLYRQKSPHPVLDWLSSCKWDLQILQVWPRRHCPDWSQWSHSGQWRSWWGYSGAALTLDGESLSASGWNRISGTPLLGLPQMAETQCWQEGQCRLLEVQFAWEVPV